MATPELLATIADLRAHETVETVNEPVSTYVQLYDEFAVDTLVDFLLSDLDRAVTVYADKRLATGDDAALADAVEGARWCITRRVLYPLCNARGFLTCDAAQRRADVDAFGRERLHRLVRAALEYDAVNALTNMQYVRGGDRFGMIWTTDVAPYALPEGASATINKRYAPLVAEFPDLASMIETMMPDWYVDEV